MVHLIQTGGQLAAARSGSGNQYDGLFDRNVGVLAVAFVAYNHIDVGRVARCGRVGEDTDALGFQFPHEEGCRRLVFIAGYDNLVAEEAVSGKVVYHFEDIAVVGDAEVRAHLASLDVSRIDADDYIDLVLQAFEDPHLHAGFEARQYA